MITGRRASDWLRDTAKTQASDDERRGDDRRAADRRAPRRRIDPLFAATLLNQLAPPSTDYVQGYRADAANAECGSLIARWA